MENIDAVITLTTLKEIGLVPSILIVGGWLYVLVLLLIIAYNLSLYTMRFLTHWKINDGD